MGYHLNSILTKYIYHKGGPDVGGTIVRWGGEGRAKKELVFGDRCEWGEVGEGGEGRTKEGPGV